MGMADEHRIHVGNVSVECFDALGIGKDHSIELRQFRIRVERGCQDYIVPSPNQKSPDAQESHLDRASVRGVFGRQGLRSMLDGKMAGNRREQATH